MKSDGTIHRRYMQTKDKTDVGEFTDPVKWSTRNRRLYVLTKRWGAIWAHELTWVLTYGDYPQGRVEYIDGDGKNYKASNLRLRVAKPYQARVRVGSEIRCLGSYPTREEAVAAQDAFKALMKLGIV